MQFTKRLREGEHRRRLEQERARINREIRDYPAPIPACDEQFNHLLEERTRVAVELGRLGSNVTSRVEAVALLLVVISCVLYAGIFLVPLVLETTAAQVSVGGGLIIAAEVAFWVGALLAGPTVMRRYGRWFSPMRWFRAKGSEDAVVLSAENVREGATSERPDPGSGSTESGGSRHGGDARVLPAPRASNSR